MRLLLATRNPGKQAELERVLKNMARVSGAHLQIDTPETLGLVEEPDETAATFEANSALKATWYHALTGIPSLADDGGLEIPALGNAPGVLSRRWLGRDATDEELIDYTCRRMAELPETARGARLRTCLTYRDARLELAECEAVEGWLALEPSPRRVAGYPYRSLFVVASVGRYYDELTPDQHALVNHRERAVRRLFARLPVE